MNSDKKPHTNWELTQMIMKFPINHRYGGNTPVKLTSLHLFR
jgi:hypothetical protein